MDPEKERSDSTLENPICLRPIAAVVVIDSEDAARSFSEASKLQI
jgi:hypothetical protein